MGVTIGVCGGQYMGGGVIGELCSSGDQQRGGQCLGERGDWHRKRLAARPDVVEGLEGGGVDMRSPVCWLHWQA